MRKLILSVIIVLLLLSSCRVAYRVILGIDSTPSSRTNKDILKDSKRFKMDPALVFVLDTVSYRNAVLKTYNETIKELKKDTTSIDSVLVKHTYGVVKDDLQPTQFRLFKSDKTEVFKLVNCYIDPPIPMSWNVEKCFDNFPPIISIKSLNTHNFDLDFYLSHITNLKGDSVVFTDLPKSDYYILVFWNSFFVKPSKKLIKTVRKYIKAHPEVNITPIYINNQNAEIWPHANSEQKTLISNQLNENKGLE